MKYSEEDYLPLSGIQHFAFCRRQWALIHIENQWAENERTVDGTIMHEKAHSGDVESRGDVVIMRALRVFSATLGVSGECDVVEFNRNADGISLNGHDGLWQPYPVEYKRGKPKEHNADEMQLCAQAMCLEEMLCCTIPCGALFYGEPRRRTEVEFTPELRRAVEDSLNEMHDYYKRGYTPKAKPRKGCTACSLREICLPKMAQRKSVAAYVEGALNEE